VYADIKIEASVDKKILKQNETLIFSIDISGNISSSPKIKLPDLNKDFEVLSSSQSQNISLNGRETNLTISFKYVLLPKKEGKLIIGEVEARYKREVYKTEAIEIEVLATDKIPEIKPRHPTKQGKETII
jgi:hypothetical protein